MLELVTTGEAAENNTNEAKILLDAKTIYQLKEQGVLSGLGYIYLAIEIEKAENPNPRSCEIDIEEFAQRWNLKQSQVRKALIDLDDKAVIFTNTPSTVQLSLSL